MWGRVLVFMCVKVRGQPRFVSNRVSYWDLRLAEEAILTGQQIPGIHLPMSTSTRKTASSHQHSLLFTGELATRLASNSPTALSPNPESLLFNKETKS